ncbi:MAG: PAS domain S-box protein [Thermosynechococcaceae cyanobacterium]
MPEAENGELKTALEQQVDQLTLQLETAKSRTESLLLGEQRVEAAIAHTERLTLALDAATMGWWDLDLTTGKTIWNTYHEIIFGYEPGTPERDYFDWEQRVHPDDLERMHQATHQARERHEDLSMEYRIIWPDGSLHWIDAFARFYYNEAGAPVRMLGVLTDITERKQADLALHESEERFRVTFEQAAVGVAHVDLDGHWHRVNQTLCDILGYTREELVSKTFQDITCPEDLESDLDHVRQLLAGEIEHYSLEKRYIRKDGRIIWTNLTVSLKRQMEYKTNDPNKMKAIFPILGIGKPQYFIAIIKDISDRKLADQQVRESEERLRLGVRVAGVALAKFDYATNLVVLSPEAAALYGFPADELVVSREQIHATFHPEERTELLGIIEQALDPKGTGWFAKDHRVVWKNGEIRWLSVRKQVFFDRSGEVTRPSYAILAAIDITDRKRTEAALEERNQELDRFVYIVSHDLKAPLRGIANLAEWIEEDLARQLPTENQQLLALMRSQVNRMDAMINGLLEYSKAGRVELAPEIIDIPALLAEILDFTEVPPGFKINIDAQVSSLRTRRILLHQVLLNLISNAIKHHDRPDGNLEIGVRDLGARYEFWVQDDGPGIPPEHHERIFEIFQTLKSANESTGIGLSIVKKIVEAEGGTLQLTSEVDVGSKFSFTWLKEASSEIV